MMVSHLNDGPINEYESWFCEASSGTKLLAPRYGCHLRPPCTIASTLLFLLTW